jgi:hypothetical protein
MAHRSADRCAAILDQQARHRPDDGHLCPGLSHQYSRGGLYYTVTLKRFTSPDGVEIGIAYLPDADVLFLEDER